MNERISLANHTVIGSELALSWNDGVEIYLELEALRRACPCAHCQGEPDVTGKVVIPAKSYNNRSFQLVDYEITGGYALKPKWADGHSTGIYAFAYLRKLGK